MNFSTSTYKILILISLLIFQCKSYSQETGRQGIKGNILWLEGNLMPSPDDASYAKRSKGTPVEREIYIYELTSIEDVGKKSGPIYTSIHSKLIKKVKSSSEGLFKVDLPPGKYSVFVKEANGFFAARFDEEGNINPVAVTKNNYSEIKILINYKAYY